jgi:ribosomal protein L16 Arg81 hydroxylase
MTGTLASVLSPITPEQFRDDYYAQKPLHIPGPPEKFSSLFNWDSLNRVLNCAPSPHPTLRLVRDGSTVAANDPASIIACIRKGATLILNDLDRYDPQVQAFNAALSHDLGEFTRVNLYVSQPAQPGFKRHYDSHDVLILQLVGAKRWHVFEASLASPLDSMKHRASTMPGEPILDVTLRPGEVMYVPRGWWHEALAQVQVTAHLTVGIFPRTGIDYLTWLIEELTEDNRWRKEFPLVFAGEADSDAARQLLAAHLGALHALLRRELMDPQLPARYQHSSMAAGRSGFRFSFPQQFSAESLPEGP